MKHTGTKQVLIIAGPTAVGKTDIAIRIARHFNTEIISADSRQCYRELNIGVARPSVEQLREVKHHFIASHSIQEEVTAAGFESYAIQKAKEIFNDHDIVVMVGGTGLYIKAFCEGLDEIPAIDPRLRQRIIQSYEANGLSWLQEQVKLKDPIFYESGEILNPQRMMRALEVWEGTGRSILDFRKGSKTRRDFAIIKSGIELPREVLDRNIRARVDHMMEQGLLQEVATLKPYRHLNALQTVGYTELFEYMDGKISLENAIEQIKIHTRQYAKRQMTWFKKDSEIKWFSPADFEKIIKLVSK